MKPGVGGNEVAGGGVERRTVHARDSACRLLHHQRTGGHVRRLEMLLPEAVDPPSRNVTEIERCGSKTANGARTTEELTKERDEITGLLMHVVREASDEKRLEEVLGRGSTKRHPVDERAFVPLGREQLAARGIENGADLDVAVDLQRERGAENRQAMGVVGRAVERVEDPSVPRRRAIRRAGAQLLGQHVVVRKALRDQRAEHPLALEIDLGDEIDRPFLFDAETRGTPRELDLAGTKDDFGGCREINRIRQVSLAASVQQSAPHPGVPLHAYFTMRISIPPSGAR